MAMDEAEMLADIASRQRTAGTSDQGSDTKAPMNPFQALKERILATPESPQSKPLSPTEIEAERKSDLERKSLAALRRVQSEAGGHYAEAAVANWRAETERQKQVRAAVVEDCRSIAERVKACEGVLLYGPVGTGKDHLAMGIAKAACLAGLAVRWLRGQEWFGSLRDAMDSDKTERDIFRGLACDVLVLSDPLPPMGALTQYQASMLYRLIEDRYAHGGVIVATVNVANDEEADSRMGAQTWDRLKDRSWMIRCEWKSFRKPTRVV